MPGRARARAPTRPAPTAACVGRLAGLPGVDLVGPVAEVPPDGVRAVLARRPTRRSASRPACPVMGRELDERTIPAEAGVVDRSVSFTKGCYTGQELVARIDSRGGNVPRRLRGIVVPA